MGSLTLLKRFGSVTVLNGHIHQIVQKIENNMTFHTARSTGFHSPLPGLRETASFSDIRPALRNVRYRG
jgi:hypothetical protein